jgi:phosphoserine phosphatase
MIEPIAEQLRIPVHRVYANTLLFEEEKEAAGGGGGGEGEYRGFDASEPTSRDGGKPAVLRRLVQAHGYGPIGTLFYALSVVHVLVHVVIRN